MNNSYIYLGVYIKAEMNNIEIIKHKLDCPNDHLFLNLHSSKYCPVCGSKLIIRTEKTTRKQNFYNLMNSGDISWDYSNEMMINSNDDYEYFLSTTEFDWVLLDEVDFVHPIKPNKIEDVIDDFRDKHKAFIDMIAPFYDNIELQYGIFVHDC